MGNRLIYMQYGFWRQIRNDDSVDGKRHFWDLYGALEVSNIIADIPLEEWEWKEEKEGKDNLLYYLYQNMVDGNDTEIEKYAPDKIEKALDVGIKQSPKNLCATYLLGQNTMMCVGHSKQLGTLCINAGMFKSLSRESAVMYEKGEKSDSFKKCQRYMSMPCNSMIIIDPYLGMNLSNIEMNLLPILNNCLPQTTNSSGKAYSNFHLSIFTQTKNCYCGKNESPISDKKLYDLIVNKVNSIRPDLDIDLTLFHIKTTKNGGGDFHSRHIITNCIHVSSEDGFDLFTERNNKEVSGKHARFIFTIPTLIDNRRLDYANYCRWIKIAAENAEKSANGDYWVSEGKNKNNRLFGIVVKYEDD